jgi:hypothetical protein
VEVRTTAMGPNACENRFVESAKRFCDTSVLENGTARPRRFVTSSLSICAVAREASDVSSAQGYILQQVKMLLARAGAIHHPGYTVKHLCPGAPALALHNSRDADWRSNSLPVLDGC